ncbi:hypothetical protein [Actinoallomurus acaciae]|uniref:Uncharacterized protein n=1 Tax=Actinoallomurus acaciae TaxID=502577 RepID=A0ABV5YDT5_9ACTN
MGLIVAGVAGCGSDHAATAHVASAQKSTGNQPVVAPQSVQSSAVKRVSFRCKSPASEFLNISYKPAWDTKFYFNNHCAQKRRITITQSGWPGSHSFTVNPRTKGNKTYYMGHNSSIHVTSS